MRSFTLDYRPGLPTRGQIMTVSQFWFRRKIKDGTPEYVVLRAGVEGSGPDQIAIEQWNDQAKTWDWAENDPTLEYAPCHRGGSPALWGDEQDLVLCQHTDHAKIYIVASDMIGLLCPGSNSNAYRLAAGPFTAEGEVLREPRIVILVPDRAEADNVNRDGAMTFVERMTRTLAADRNTVVVEPKSTRANWLRRTLAVVRNVVAVIEDMGDYHMTDKDRHVIAQVKDVVEFYRIARELRGLDHRVQIAFKTDPVNGPT